MNKSIDNSNRKEIVMDCYKIARRIIGRIRQREVYDDDGEGHGTYRGIGYYDSSADYEYFNLLYNGVRLLVSRGEIYKIEISNPRGIVFVDVRLWLLEIDRMTK